MDLKGKLALVTGSTSGIGLAISHALAKSGCDLIITGLGDEQTIANIIENIKRQSTVNVEYIGADLTKLEEIKSLTSQLLQCHPAGVDILINNAGIFHSGPIEDVPDEKWDALVAVNLTAAFQFTKLLLPTMKKKGWGRIINMSSAVGVVARKNFAVYAAMKHGLIGLTKGVALEVGEYGITCNAVCPGLVASPMGFRSIELDAIANNVSYTDQKEAVRNSLPTKKFLSTDQVAELVLLLIASIASDQITGSHYLIDYGFTAA